MKSCGGARKSVDFVASDEGEAIFQKDEVYASVRS